MRAHVTIALDENRSVKIMEARPSDVRGALLKYMGKNKNKTRDKDKDKTEEAFDITKLLTEDYDDVLERLSSCLEFSDDSSLNDCSFSEVDEIATVFIKVNAPFFKLLRMAGWDVNLLIGSASKNSTEPSPFLSNEDIPTSGATDGASTLPPNGAQRKRRKKPRR